MDKLFVQISIGMFPPKSWGLSSPQQYASSKTGNTGTQTTGQNLSSCKLTIFPQHDNFKQNTNSINDDPSTEVQCRIRNRNKIIAGVGKETEALS